MRFLVFNLTVLAALAYLFAGGQTGGVDRLAERALGAAERAVTYAQSVIAGEADTRETATFDAAAADPGKPTQVDTARETPRATDTAPADSRDPTPQPSAPARADGQPAQSDDTQAIADTPAAGSAATAKASTPPSTQTAATDRITTDPAVRSRGSSAPDTAGDDQPAASPPAATPPEPGPTAAATADPEPTPATPEPASRGPAARASDAEPERAAARTPAPIARPAAQPARSADTPETADATGSGSPERAAETPGRNGSAVDQPVVLAEDTPLMSAPERRRALRQLSREMELLFVDSLQE
jgi:hypothetical protein